MKKKIVSALCLIFILASLVLMHGCGGNSSGGGSGAGSISGSGE